METSVSCYLCQTLPQLLGISALAAALRLLGQGTASTTLQLSQPLERCCFQVLFSNTYSALPQQSQRDASCYRGERVPLRLQLPSQLHWQWHNAGTWQCPAPHGTFVKLFAREVRCNSPCTRNLKYCNKVIHFADRGLPNEAMVQGSTHHIGEYAMETKASCWEAHRTSWETNR